MPEVHTVTQKEDPAKRPYTTFSVRVPTELLNKFDPKGVRNRKIVELIREYVAKSGQSITVNYKALKDQAEDCRRTMERMRKILNSKKDRIEAVTYPVGELKPENIGAIIDFLLSRPENEEADGFNKLDVEDYIQYLEAWQQHESLFKQMNDYRKTVKAELPPEPEPKEKLKGKPGRKPKTPEKRFIPPELLCGCGIYETKEEHNMRMKNA